MSVADTHVRVQLLGPPRLIVERDPPDVQAVFDGMLDRKSAALLALAHYEPGITRSTAARWLWPDSDGPAARANLRVLLYRLAKQAGRILIASRNFLALEHDVVVGDETPVLRAIHASLGQWQGLPPLLQGVDTDDLPELDAWLERTRRRVAGRIAAALRERLVALEESGRLAAAAALGERLVEFDPNQESGWRELMRVQIARGERSAALAAFERCRHWLSDQFGVKPSVTTMNLQAQALQLDERPQASAPGAMSKALALSLAIDAAVERAPVVTLCRRIERIMDDRAGDRAELERIAHAAALRLPAPELAADEQAYACGIVARFHLRSGRNAAAADWSDQAVDAARRAGADRLCWALGQRANIAVEAFDLPLACALLAESEAHARSLGQGHQLSRVWHQIGTMLQSAGMLDEAEGAMRRSIALHEMAVAEGTAPTDEETAARLPAMRINLAGCLLDRQRHALAEAALDQSLDELDKRRGFRMRELRAVALLHLAHIHRMACRLGRARTALALARAEMDDLTMQRNQLFADLGERLLAQAHGGRSAAQATLDWAAVVECPAALRIHLLRDVAAVCRVDGHDDVAQRAEALEAQLQVGRCRAVQRGHARRWLREFAHPIGPVGSVREAGTSPAGEVGAASLPADGSLPPDLAVVERMAILAELRAGRDGGHGRRVARLAARLARRLGVPAGLAEAIEPAARLHDIGWVALPDAVAQGRRDDALGVRHAELGAMLLAGHPSPLAALAQTLAHQHHEHWDGRGHPLGLAGTAIGLPARIVAVADVYDRAVTDVGPPGATAALPLAKAGAAARPGGVVERRAESGRTLAPPAGAAELTAGSDGTAARPSADAATAHARGLAAVRAAAGARLDPHLAATFVRLLEDAPPPRDLGLAEPALDTAARLIASLRGQAEQALAAIDAAAGVHPLKPTRAVRSGAG